MREKIPEDFYFSQLALKMFAQCPLKFRYRYLDQLYWPRGEGDREQQQILEKGNRFHRLARNYYDRGVLTAEHLLDKQLQKWWQRLKEFCPYEQPGEFFPEFELRLNSCQYRLLAKYDLIVINEEQGEVVIYDWKTNKRPIKQEKMVDDLQTMVYLLVLVRAVNRYFRLNGEIKPDDMKIIYWNPRFPGEKVAINCSEQKSAVYAEQIEKIIHRIKKMSYQQFAELKNNLSCDFCQYFNLCREEESDAND